MQTCLAGKTAIITGSTRGIGRGIAEAMAAAGAGIVVVSRSPDDCRKVAEELAARGTDALGFAADVTRRQDFDSLISRVLKHFGRIDILVNNAGTAVTRKAEDISEEEWDRVISLDLKSVFFCSQAVGREMINQRSGKIINIASVLGLVGEKMVLPYCAAKGGVVQMTRALALEWAKHNIQVNALCPGYVLTDINAAELQKEKNFNYITGKTPAGRLGTVGDITGAAVFLASPAAEFMTGQTLTIDGGWTAQ